MISNAAPYILSAATVLLAADFTTGAWGSFIQIHAPPPIEGSAEMVGGVHAGETTLVVWEIVKRTDCRGNSSRVWSGVDGYFLQEASRPTRLPTTPDLKQYNIPTVIPDTAPVGPLSLTIEGEYTCGDNSPVSFILGPVVTEVTEVTE